MEQNLMEKLNKEQLKAVTHKEGPLLIIAGAGTGKTTVVTQRIAYLIEQGKARPEEVLALTFTEKAAGEMQERVDRLLPMGYLDLWISTFHGFGERILKDHGLDIGLPGDARLLNEFEQYALIKNNIDKFELDYYRPLGNPNKFIGALIKHFSRLKDEDINPAQYLEFAGELQENFDTMLSGGGRRKSTKSQAPNNKQIPNITNEEGEIDKELAIQEINRINEVASAYHFYQQLLLEAGAMDFGDLINYCLKLFRERPGILKKYQKQFKYIMLDEFQDTNWAQYELIKMLAGEKNNVVVVGDDDQSVYKFRGASVSNILQFKKDYQDAKEVVLVKNYRNKQNILDLAYDFIQLNNPNRLEYTLQKSGKDAEKPTPPLRGTPPKRGISEDGKVLSKKLRAENAGEGTIEVIEEEDLQGEMRAVVERIADVKLGNKDLSWNDFAILVRANESAKEACAHLDAAGLPYIFLASRGLYAKPVIMDVVAYFKLLDSYHESPAVYRILNLELFGFTEAELINFNFVAKKKTWSLYTVLKNSRGKFGDATEKKIGVVLSLIEKHTALARRKHASEIMIAFLNDSGYLKYILDKDEAEAQETLGYLNKFLKRIKEFEAASDEKSIKAFLEELTVEIESGEEGAVSPDPEAGPEAIKVMTIHAAKGLEFKHVFLTNMVDLRFPTTKRKEAIEIPDALVKEIVPAGDIHLEEERRLFYVAITRAGDGIYFSWAKDYGGARKKKASRFLLEANLIKEDFVKKPQSLNPKSQIINNKQIPIPKSQIPNKKAAHKMPGYFSYTQLAAFNNCPYQYRFAHILKVPRKSKFTFSFGQTMHSALQRIFQVAGEKGSLGQDTLFEAGKKSESRTGVKAKIGWEEVKKIYEECWIDEWYDSEAQRREYRKLGLISLKGFLDKYKDDWPRVVSLEQGINLKVSGYKIFGKIDRMDEQADGGIQIVDYKTGKPKTGDKVSAEDKEQLLIYQLACEQVFEKKIANLQFYYLNDNSELNFVGTDKELRNMEEKILTRIDGIKKAVEANSFPPKPGPLCKFCDFNSICEFRKL